MTFFYKLKSTFMRPCDFLRGARAKKTRENQKTTDEAQPGSEGDQNLVSARSHLIGAVDLNKRDSQPMASFSDLFRFSSGPKKKTCLSIGLFLAGVAGLSTPVVAGIFTYFLQVMAASPTSLDFIGDINVAVFAWVGLGFVSLGFFAVQLSCMDIAAEHLTTSFKTEWFRALMKQDMAFHDLVDTVGMASSISTSAHIYQLGVGHKLGEGIQGVVSLVSGFAFAFWTSWKTSLLILAFLPIFLFC
jgi:ABC-type multidrug transport system fused ATPase/permease subunit